MENEFIFLYVLAYIKKMNLVTLFVVHYEAQ